jgi:phosphohistidine phosphatase SixA
MKSFARPSRALRRGLFALAAACVAALLLHHPSATARVSPGVAQGAFPVTTVFLVRHAERADAPAEDPTLTEAGKQRSETLARMLAGSGIKAIYTSQFMRAKLTAEPLAKQLGLTATPLTIKLNPSNPREPSEQSIAEITDKIYAQAGGGVLVVGHSNTVPAVIKMLGGDVVPKIDEKKFDDLFVVTVYEKGKAKVAQLKYGPAN